MFDPYHQWLAIPRGTRPPTYYQLLGVAPDEDDPEVIAEAALRQTSHVRTYQAGPQGEQCVALLNEIALARTTLLDAVKRRAYDATLPPPAEPVALSPVPAPVPPTEPADLDWSATAPEPRQPARTDPWAIVYVFLYVLLILLGAGLAFWLGAYYSGSL